jgi:hypothetical protein
VLRTVGECALAATVLLPASGEASMVKLDERVGGGELMLGLPTRSLGSICALSSFLR